MDDAQWRFSHGGKVEAKYCPIEIDGDVKYYICPRNEICCTFGCCISSNFHFYQLWYYWLMVILMFLLCSGGTWWYRYWLQESHYPPVPAPSLRAAPPRHRPPTTAAPLVSYHRGRPHRVVLHHTWNKNRNSQRSFPPPPPSYSFIQHQILTDIDDSSGSGGTTQDSEPKSCPYYQLYGPPPSYDSVVTQTSTDQRQSSEFPGVAQANTSVETNSECQSSRHIISNHSDEVCQGASSDAQDNVERQSAKQQRALQSTSRTTLTFEPRPRNNNLEEHSNSK